MHHAIPIYCIPEVKNNWGGKMKLEALMLSLWQKYLDTKDINYLAEACEKAPFFGQRKMGKEIAKILRKN